MRGIHAGEQEYSGRDSALAKVDGWLRSMHEITQEPALVKIRPSGDSANGGDRCVWRPCALRAARNNCRGKRDVCMVADSAPSMARCRSDLIRLQCKNLQELDFDILFPLERPSTPHSVGVLDQMGNTCSDHGEGTIQGQTTQIPNPWDCWRTATGPWDCWRTATGPDAKSPILTLRSGWIRHCHHLFVPNYRRRFTCPRLTQFLDDLFGFESLYDHWLAPFPQGFQPAIETAPFSVERVTPRPPMALRLRGYNTQRGYSSRSRHRLSI